MSQATSTDAASELRSLGYFVLPLPPRQKEPPPKGWITRTKPYEVRPDDNIALGFRGEVAVLITNDARATTWAKEQFGEPNVWSVRGGHWYFSATQGLANQANRETTVGEMELHVRNKYALVPPSVHPTGALYRWGRSLPRVQDLPICPDVRELWNPRGEHHGKLLALSTAQARGGKSADEIFTCLCSWRDGHLTDPSNHPDHELRQLADSAVAKFGSSGPEQQEGRSGSPASPAGVTSHPPLQEFDPATAELFETVDEAGRRVLGIVFVYEHEIHGTTLPRELQRIADDTGAGTGRWDKKRWTEETERLLRSLPFTSPRDAFWPLPGDPTPESVRQWESRKGPVHSNLVTYYKERAVPANPGDLDVLSLWTQAAAAQAPDVDFASRLLLEGAFGSGKSTVAESIQLVVPRTVYGAALTAAAVYRLLNEYHVTLVVDESAINDNVEFLRVLRAGFKRGAKIVRASQNSDSGLVTVDPFGHLILTTQVDSRDDLVNRCFQFLLSPGRPTKRVTSRDPEAKDLRTVLTRLRLEVLCGTLVPDLGLVAERVRDRGGLEPRCHDKLTGLWPWAVRAGVEERLIAAVTRLEETFTEQLAGSDKGLVVAAVQACVERAGGLAGLKAADLEVRQVQERVEALLLEQGEANRVPVSGGETEARIDLKRYGPRGFTSPKLRELGFRIHTTKGRPKLDLAQFKELWPSVLSRYEAGSTLDDWVAPALPSPQNTSTPPLPPSASTSADTSGGTSTPPLPFPYPSSTPIEAGGRANGVGVEQMEGAPAPPQAPGEQPSSASVELTGTVGDQRVSEAVGEARSYLRDRSGGSEFGQIRAHLISAGFTEIEADRALGRIAGGGEAVQVGEVLRLKSEGGAQ